MPAPDAAVGMGAPLVTASGQISTAMWADVRHRGVFGCAHGIPLHATLAIDDGQPNVLGRCTARVMTRSGAELGPRWPRKERFLIDLAFIQVDESVTPSADAPGGHPVRMLVPSEAAELLLEQPAAAMSGRRSIWLEGRVISLWPKPNNAAFRFTGLCLIDHRPLAASGDSGTAWLIKPSGQLLLAGGHFGLDWTSSRSPRLAFVSMACEWLARTRR